MAPGSTKKLPRSFYERPTLDVAPDLIGKYLIYLGGERQMVARIVEVEAYIGQDDPACHASRGLTERTKPMFGPPGFTYVYLIYGMYHCLNFVTEPDGRPAAVSIRAAEPVQGFELLISELDSKRDEVSLLMGPGKLCRAFDLTKKHNNLDLTGKMLFCEDRHEKQIRVVTSQRIGIMVGTRRRWRFCVADSTGLSRPANDSAK